MIHPYYSISLKYFHLSHKGSPNIILRKFVKDQYGRSRWKKYFNLPPCSWNVECSTNSRCSEQNYLVEFGHAKKSDELQVRKRVAEGNWFCRSWLTLAFHDSILRRQSSCNLSAMPECTLKQSCLMGHSQGNWSPWTANYLITLLSDIPNPWRSCQGKISFHRLLLLQKSSCIGPKATRQDSL